MLFDSEMAELVEQQEGTSNPSTDETLIPTEMSKKVQDLVDVLDTLSSATCISCPERKREPKSAMAASRKEHIEPSTEQNEEVMVVDDITNGFYGNLDFAVGDAPLEGLQLSLFKVENWLNDLDGITYLPDQKQSSVLSGRTEALARDDDNNTTDIQCPVDMDVATSTITEIEKMEGKEFQLPMETNGNYCDENQRNNLVNSETSKVPLAKLAAHSKKEKKSRSSTKKASAAKRVLTFLD